MTKRLLLMLAVSSFVAACSPARAQDQAEVPAPPPVFRYVEGKLVSGEWEYNFAVSGGGEFEVAGPVTSFAFAPGRSEIAYCTIGADGQPSRLWTVSFSPEEVWKTGVKTMRTPPRRVCDAPLGVTLSGPIWWSPDARSIALRVFRGETADLVAIDYLSGETSWLTDGTRVVDAAWSPSGKSIAFVTGEDPGSREVFLLREPPCPADKLGSGGFDLRWSLDGQNLSWLEPTPDGSWAAMTWDAGTPAARQTGCSPPRSPNAVWSPDGQLCADLVAADSGRLQVAIYPRNSPIPDLIDLPDAGMKALLGWSPDSNLVIALGAMDIAFAIAAYPPALDVEAANMEAARFIDPETPGPRAYTPYRAHVLTTPLDLTSGPPSWFARGDLVAWIPAQSYDASLLPFVQPDSRPTLVVSNLKRRFIAEFGADVDQILRNMKTIALALRMFLADHDDSFPGVWNIEELRRALDDYVPDQDVFLRPGSDDVIVESYLPPDPLSLAQVEDPSTLPVAGARLRTFSILAYADGHVAKVSP